ncbi:PRC-barrel domain-containing protein [Legionella oakridgensis]|nr:PRC-barrel domain-containing protein [Legionella oakridgensis]
MLDKLQGCVSYVVLSFGGFLEMGDKLFAMPWDVLKNP